MDVCADLPFEAIVESPGRARVVSALELSDCPRLDLELAA